MKTLTRVATAFWIVLLGSGLGACALMTAPPNAYWLDAKAPPPAGEAVSLLHYSAYARKLGSRQLAEELERVRLAYAAEKSDFRLLQYVMALSVPVATAAEHRRALQLVEPLTQSDDRRDRDLQALASMMHASLTEQRRLEEGSASQAQRVREEQRRAEELEKKLEALKDIEKSLLRPEKSAGSPK